MIMTMIISSHQGVKIGRLGNWWAVSKKDDEGWAWPESGYCNMTQEHAMEQTPPWFYLYWFCSHSHATRNHNHSMQINNRILKLNDTGVTSPELNPGDKEVRNRSAGTNQSWIYQTT